MINTDSLTEDQEHRLQEAIRCAFALCEADTADNHSTCSSYRIKPFNTHWDEKTVQEVKEHVTMYVKSWILSPLEDIFKPDLGIIKKQSLLQYHKQEVKKLESEIKATKI